jgi:hypothetical protein
MVAVRLLLRQCSDISSLGYHWNSGICVTAVATLCRSKGGNHCHLNTIGISRAAGETAAEVFQKLAGEAGLQLVAVPAVDGQMDM